MDDLTYRILMNPAESMLLNLAVLVLGGVLVSSNITVTRPMRRVSYLVLTSVLWFLIPISMFPWLAVDAAAREGMIGLVLTFSLLPILLFGALTWVFAARRSIDMTGTTKKAWMGFVPFANLVLVFTAGQNAAERRKVRPAISKFFLDPILIMAALLIFATASLINKVFENGAGEAIGNSPALIAELTTRTPLEEYLDIMASEATPTLPSRIDEVTVLTGITSEGETIRFRYAVERDIVSLKENFGEIVTQNICTQPAIRTLIDRGARVTQTYENTSGQVIGNYGIARADCEAMRLY